MKRFTILALLITTLFTGCIPDGPKANINDLQLISGIRDRKLILEGSEGVSSTFSFYAKQDWSIIDYKGFTCDPSSGTKCLEDEVITVTATPLQSNNSADTIRLSDLNFKMLSTRFVGISAYQLPQIRLPKGNKITVDASEGSEGSATFVTSNDDFKLIVEGEIIATLGEKNSKGEYTVTVKANTDNFTPSSQVIGTVGFEINGVRQGSKIEVVQTSAIILDRSEVILPSKAGGENLIIVESDFEIVAKSSSTLFTISKAEKRGSTYTFAVKSKSANTSANTISLGKIELSLTNSTDCNITIEVKQRKAIAPQTIIVHFIGTALQYYFNDNISKMLQSLSSNIQGDAQVVVITTDSTNKGSLYELRYDKSAGKAVKEKVREISLPTPYDYSVLKNNIAAAMDFAPAEKYSLVIGSHGLGWIPVENYPDNSVQQLSHDGKRVTEIWKRNESAEMTRHFGDNDYTRYDVSELARAIKENNVEMEYILFDACFMGNVESVYELREVTKWIVASPCEVMGYGFPYARVMKHMLENKGTSYNLEKLCYEYVNHYKTDAVTPSACVALTNTSELEALAAAMKEVFKCGDKAGFSLDAVQYYEGLSPHVFYDLGHIVELSCADANVAARFKAQLDKTVTSRHHTDSFYSAYSTNNTYYHPINYFSGISTSYKCKTYEYDWKKSAWYAATH